MVEDLGETLVNGFKTWKDNIVMALPYVFSTVLSSIVSIAFIGGALFMTIPSLTPFLVDTPEMPFNQLMILFSQILENSVPIVTAVIITLLLNMLIGAFFNAGAIGMAKEATQKGKTDLSDMISYGRKKFASLFFATLIINLITFIGIMFLLPGLMRLIPSISSSSVSPTQAVLSALPLLTLGFLATGIYIFIISIIFAPSRYAIVISDLKAIDGLKEGFNFFMENKVSVFLLFLIVGIVMMLPTLILGSIPYVGGVLSMIMMVVLIQPLVVLWWSRLYLRVTRVSS
ncbi:MAG: hypothetical protein SVK08_09085 [Halobacteriota archaeon]|nr:hypothetical protein [Halobacteriota archaeon]